MLLVLDRPTLPPSIVHAEIFSNALWCSSALSPPAIFQVVFTADCRHITPLLTSTLI